ncbi:uncharacterized protein EHS24_009303 [Apiotrichum porosum]|uniref:Topoisomerase 6 subunit A/Spo11 TOPRIM domain-containing protein n=1 Tax=Apiotrichum porosum TaxID=105984 RepID=A0A427XL90_9TREE|nr:uncharacterized protein EHS24_009303 [Apiotrichum porosum]RSH79651.1 hypothetical protein EHS24_009303 [Apiotrichum porosum]
MPLFPTVLSRSAAEAQADYAFWMEQPFASTFEAPQIKLFPEPVSGNMEAAGEAVDAGYGGDGGDGGEGGDGGDGGEGGEGGREEREEREEMAPAPILPPSTRPRLPTCNARAMLSTLSAMVSWPSYSAAFLTSSLGEALNVDFGLTVSNSRGILLQESGWFLPFAQKLTQTELVSLMVDRLLALFEGNTMATPHGVWYWLDGKTDMTGIREQVVQDWLESLASGAGLPLWAFRLRPSGKGIMAATDLQAVLTDGTTLPFFQRREMITPFADEVARFVGKVDCIVFAEKELQLRTSATFGRTNDSPTSSHLRNPDNLGYGVLITGKGQTDECTRQALALLSDSFPSARILALVDPDPYGVTILSVLKYGRRQGPRQGDGKVVYPRRVGGIASKPVPRASLRDRDQADRPRLGVRPDVFRELKPNARSMAKNLLASPDLCRDWLPELALMLRYGSAHIEVALDIDNGRRFDTYLRNVIVEGLNEALLYS